MLLGNYSVANKTPGRQMGGAIGSDTRAEHRKSGPARGRFYGVEDLANHQKYGTPNGYLPPYSWVIPQVSGGLASNTLIIGTGAFTSGAAGGKNATATLAGVGELTAPLQLIVSAVAALTGVGLIDSAAAVAFLNATATLTGSGSATATADGVALILAALTGVGTVTSVLNATGELDADVTPFTELSPESLAAAVWATTSGDTTTGDALTFLHALGHNKIVTDPTAGTFTVYDTDGTTVLYTADLWQDATGLTPYAGAGSERRDGFT